jgi:parvulin-like peptidyl-prolyl isomerase
MRHLRLVELARLALDPSASQATRRIAVARNLYPAIFCSTLVLLGAILLRPGTAQELIDLARQVRGQAPDPSGPGYTPGASPGLDPRVRSQFDSIPQAPTQPMPVRYPTVQAEPPPGPNGAVPASYSPGAAQPLASAIIVARVGPDTILDSDILKKYSMYARAKADGAPASALAPAREQIAAELRNMADAKILFAEAAKNIPPEGLKDLEKKMNEQFEKTQVKEMMQKAKCDTREQLEAKLRDIGTSIERRRQAFFETNVAFIWIKKQIEDEEIPYADILAYYKNNPTKFDHEAVAKWEQLTARFDRFATKAEAKEAICRMGDDVLKGIPFADVARSASQGPTAANGGQRDWTTHGSLKSKRLDEAIFGTDQLLPLPVKVMSEVLEDEDGYHIIRILERKDAYRTPYLEAQVEIKKQLQDEQTDRKKKAYLSKLQQQNPVWTIFDGQPPLDAGAARP